MPLVGVWMGLVVTHHHQSECHHDNKLYHHLCCLEMTVESVQVMSFAIASHLIEVLSTSLDKLDSDDNLSLPMLGMKSVWVHGSSNLM